MQIRRIKSTPLKELRWVVQLNLLPTIFILSDGMMENFSLNFIVIRLKLDIPLELETHKNGYSFVMKRSFNETISITNHPSDSKNPEK